MSDTFRGRTVGYQRGKNLMKQLDWKLKVTTSRGRVDKVVIYHPKQPKAYTVRRDSRGRLLSECRVCKRVDDDTLIFCYDHDGSNEAMI